MKLLKNRKFQIALIAIVFIIVAILSINRFSGVNVIRNIVTIPVTWAQQKINDIEKYYKQLNVTRKQYSELLEENKALKGENEILTERNAALSYLLEENLLLRQALHLKDIFEGYNIIGCNIMGAEPGSHVYRYKIDIGTKNKTYPDMPVIAANNTLYGRVYSVGYNTSVIIPIIDETEGISGWIAKTGGGHVSISGDIRYKEQGLCIITNISDHVTIEVGDVVETSGFGGVYPKGILIGVITDVFYNEITKEQSGLLKPYVDFVSIDKVFVMMEKTQ